MKGDPRPREGSLEAGLLHVHTPLTGTWLGTWVWGGANWKTGHLPGLSQPAVVCICLCPPPPGCVFICRGH